MIPLLNAGIASGSYDPYWGDVVLLLPMETNFDDLSPQSQSISVNGSVISTAKSKFGSASGFFDGVDDYLLVGNSLLPATDDFTIECFIYTDNLNTGYIFSQKDAAVSNPGRSGFYKDSSGLQFFINGTAWAILLSDLFDISTWQHVAVTRDGTTLRMFINGVIVDSVTTSNSIAQDDCFVGSYGGEDNFFNGYFEQFRITVGIARYTSAFTPPAAPFATA
jgi:hypothetical protein